MLFLHLMLVVGYDALKASFHGFTGQLLRKGMITLLICHLLWLSTSTNLESAGHWLSVHGQHQTTLDCLFLQNLPQGESCQGKSISLARHLSLILLMSFPQQPRASTLCSLPESSRAGSQQEHAPHCWCYPSPAVLRPWSQGLTLSGSLVNGMWNQTSVKGSSCNLL